MGRAIWTGGYVTRFVHLDETGVSNKIATEPYTIVAGVIHHADSQTKALEGHLAALADEYAPTDRRDEFYFHAADIYHGSPKGFFPRDTFDQAHRWKILDALLAIPKSFDLYVVYGADDRAKTAQSHPDLDANGLSILTHALAFGECITFIERFMGAIAPNEVAWLVAENRPEAHEAIKAGQKLLKDPAFYQGAVTDLKIVGTPYFASKQDAPLLQLADVCAFAVRLQLKGSPDAGRFFGAIEDDCIVEPTELLISKMASGKQAS